MSASSSSFRDHFSGHAADYANARPHYPDALFDWLASQCPRRALAWDAGCGNGQASVALAKHFESVYASDPSAEQIAAAHGSVSAAGGRTPEAAAAEQHQRVRYAVEAAEHCSLPAACADLVVVAQAMHWFDVPRFQAEARRVLVTDGVFAAWTYAQSRVTPAVDAVFDRFHDHLLEGYWPDGRQHVIDGYARLPFAFERLRAPSFEMCCDWTLPQYFAYLRSWSACEKYRRATGKDAVALIEDEMRAAWGDPQQVRAVVWPLMLHVGRA